MISMDFPTKQRILPLDTSIGSKRRSRTDRPEKMSPASTLGTSLQELRCGLRSLQVGGFDAISVVQPATEVGVPLATNRQLA